LLHADFDHLIANSLPLLVLGTTLFHLYPQSAFRVLAAVYLGPESRCGYSQEAVTTSAPAALSMDWSPSSSWRD
jgi:hypothetical protein